MIINRFYIAFVFVIFLFFAACSSDDDSNPADSNTPETVGEYSGNNSMDTTMTITISNVGGQAYMTGYSVNYKNTEGTVRGNYGETNSDGLVLVANNTFSYSLGSETDEVLVGTINGNTMIGSFKFPSVPFSGSIAGTFTITKK